MDNARLVSIGLSRDEAECYKALIKEGSLSTSQLAEMIKVLPNAVYRLMKRLQEKGFVIPLNTYPATFQAVPPTVAVDSYIEQRQKKLDDLRIKSIAFLLKNQPILPTKVDVLVSQKIYFNKFVELANSTKSEILVISIGEPVLDEIKIACARAVEREVTIKFIFHVHNKENEQLLKAWVRMGIEVRHYKDAGYHLNIFDGKIAVLVANNPQNSKERTGMVFYNERLANSLRDYFNTLWERAIPIKA